VQDISCELERAFSPRRDIAGDVVFQLVGSLTRHIGISISTRREEQKEEEERGGARCVFISLTIYERVKRSAHKSRSIRFSSEHALSARNEKSGQTRTRGGVAQSRSCLHTRVERRDRGPRAREIRDTPWLDVVRNETHAARPPLLGPRGIIYHDRRGRAGGNFVPLAAGESPRYSRPDIILLYLRSERGRVVYQQPSEPRFSPFTHLTPPFLALLLSLLFSRAFDAPFASPRPLRSSSLLGSTAVSFYRAALGNNIVLAGSNGGNVWPTFRAKGGQTSPEDAKGERAEPLCHAVFTERLLRFLHRLLLFSRVERLPPPIITTFAPTGADLSSRFAEGPRFDVERHARKRSRLLLSALLAPNVAAIIRARHENANFSLAF